MSIAETHPPEVDVDMARRFLRLVDANDTFTFQTFHDRQKGTEEDRTLARVDPRDRQAEGIVQPSRSGRRRLLHRQSD